MHSLPDDLRRPNRLRGLISSFGAAPGNDAENGLFQLAEADPRLYNNYDWREATIRLGTPSSARRLVNLAATGAFEGMGADRWHMVRQIGTLIKEYDNLRTHVYQLLEGGATTPGLALLAEAVAEAPDATGVLLLIRIEKEHKCSFISKRTIENVVTEPVPSENWKGSYSIVPVSAAELRRKLLAMMEDGGRMDIAARCLNQIDEIRDEYGVPDSEPRHPDLASGKRWPVMSGPEHVA